MVPISLHQRPCASSSARYSPSAVSSSSTRNSAAISASFHPPRDLPEVATQLDEVQDPRHQADTCRPRSRAPATTARSTSRFVAPTEVDRSIQGVEADEEVLIGRVDVLGLFHHSGCAPTRTM